MKAKKSVQGNPPFHKVLKISLGYMRAWLKERKAWETQAQPLSKDELIPLSVCLDTAGAGLPSRG